MQRDGGGGGGGDDAIAFDARYNVRALRLFSEFRVRTRCRRRFLYPLINRRKSPRLFFANMLGRNVERASQPFWLTLALVCVFVAPAFLYVLPDPTFEVLTPQGLRVSIPDAPGLRIFGFHANINKAIRNNEHGEIAGDVFIPRNGRWTFENPEITIKNRDVLHYWIYAQTDEGGTDRKNNQMWTYFSSTGQEITSDGEQNTTPKNKAPAEGRLLLEDNFNFLNTSLWSREIKMPLSPDYEFCLYHNANHQQLVQIDDGYLRIRPIILEDSYGENATAYGRMQLNGCTSVVEFECSRQALSYSILPPVISARFTTKERFSLRYGKIEIRAKFPEGDWIYPEMWLDPKYSMYGLNYASGRILLGLARGNEHLVNPADISKIYDSRRLEFGLRVGISPYIQQILVSKVQESGPRWTQDFHVYTTIWTSDGFTFMVDGEEIGRLNSGPGGWIHGANSTVGRRSAPFDQEFYITLGVGAGGVRVFPDDTISREHPKPWKNTAAKSMLRFWNSRNQWLPSWRRNDGEKTAFVIDYVRVWAL